MFENNFLFIGLPCWALVNGTWASLSLLAQNLPEGYNISAYLLLALTLGNFLPFYLGGQMYKYSRQQLVSIIQCVNFVGFMTGIFLAVFWDRTVTIWHKEYSVPLYILFYICGACASSTSVTHFTYVAKFSPLSTTYLTAGMGLGSMAAGLFALLQSNLFPSKIYLRILFIFISCMFIPSTISIYRVENLDSVSVLKSPMDEEKVGLLSKSAQRPVSKEDGEASPVTASPNFQVFEEWNVVRANLLLLTMAGLGSALGHGVAPAIISTVCGRFVYPASTLSFATGQAAVCDPIFRFFTAYYRFSTLTAIVGATVVLCALTTVLLVLAVLPSSSAIFQYSLGGVVAVLTNVVFISLFVFTNTSSFLYLKDTVSDSGIGYAYKWNGIFVQLGAAIGASITLLLIVMNIL